LPDPLVGLAFVTEEGNTMDELRQALAKHGTPVDAVLAGGFEHWPVGAAMQLLALMAKQIAESEKARQPS
jgi:hypothetical protein